MRPMWKSTYPETHLPERCSGSRLVLDVIAEVLDAARKLGNGGGGVACDQVVGAQVLIDRAVFQHVIDRR